MAGTIKTIIFDFDGTIANTLEEGMKIVNSLAKEFRFKPVPESDYERLRALDSLAMLRSVGVSLWRLPALVLKVQKQLQAKIPVLKTYPGITETLLQLKQQDYKLGILSSDTADNVSVFLKNNNLEIFDFIHSEKNLFGKGRSLKHLLKRYAISPQETVYIGDETRDIEAARQAGIQMVSVTWGVNSRTILSSLHPDFIIDKPGQLLEILIK